MSLEQENEDIKLSAPSMADLCVRKIAVQPIMYALGVESEEGCHHAETTCCHEH
jgi:hypothetical protein